MNTANWFDGDPRIALAIREQKEQVLVSVVDHGAIGDGTTDDTAALQAAIATVPSGGVVFFPAGTYVISSTLDVTANGVTLQGAGRGATILRAASAMAGAVMLQIGSGAATIGDCNVYDLMLDSATQKTGSAAIDIYKGFRTNIARVRTNKQYVSIHVHNSTATWITDCDLRDQAYDGIAYDSDINSGYDLYVTNVLADNPTVTNTGCGINWTGGENLVVHNCDFIHFQQGLQLAPGAGRQCRWGFLHAAEFDTASDNCWKLTNAQGDIVGITFTDCWAGTAVNYGVLLDGSGPGTFTGVRISASKIVHNGLAGVRLIAGAKNVSITDCDIIANSQTSSNSRSGIEVTAGTTDFVIAGCQITNGWQQGSTQSNGINFDYGATDYFLIDANNVRGNDNQGINNLTGVTGTHAKVSNNIGFNPRGPLAAPTMPATTVALTNPFNTDCTVYVHGGTVTAIAVGGTATGMTSGTFRVPAGQSIALTYSVAPSWTWFGD